LLRNATQSTGTSRVQLSWGIAANHEIFFRVDDDGTGIEDEIKPRIFEPFFSMRNNSANTGLGLSVVHGIIQEHGGSIQADDGVLGGAGFQITLPPQTESAHPDQGDENG
ncbi:MAG: HAMP domain-containing sensor histidine kinase, partial [Desulfosudaceae bacterium]